MEGGDEVASRSGTGFENIIADESVTVWTGMHAVRGRDFQSETFSVRFSMWVLPVPRVVGKAAKKIGLIHLSLNTH